MWQTVLNSALQAAERAGAAAKELSKKGLEIAEATADEASKKLQDLANEQGAGTRTPPPPQADLEAFGVTPEFTDFVRTLNYSTFRDFPVDHLPPLNDAEGSTSGEDRAAAAASHVLNPWQVRHATLVVRVAKEVDELRFVLCPRYVTDEVFWHIYFTLVRKHLPDKAYNWGPDDVLPRSAVGGEGDEEPFSLASLGKQLSKISSKLPPVTGPQGLELTSFVGGSSRREAAGSSSSGGAGATQASPVPAAPAVPRKPEGLLENDPDLEAYLEVAITDAKESGEEESGGEELDLDSLMAQLEEEEEPAVGEGASAPAVKQ